MAGIDVIPLERATGFLKKEYEAAMKWAGRIWRYELKSTSYEDVDGFL